MVIKIRKLGIEADRNYHHIVYLPNILKYTFTVMFKNERNINLKKFIYSIPNEFFRDHHGN